MFPVINQFFIDFIGNHHNIMFYRKSCNFAEKPSLGRAIADGLGGGSKRNGYIDCGKDVVTWCFGHLLEMLPPDGYDPEYKNWKKEHLPIIPAKWLYSPSRC